MLKGIKIHKQSSNQQESVVERICKKSVLSLKLKNQEVKYDSDENKNDELIPVEKVKN